MKRSTWNDLSMRERAAYIKAGVNNGIYDLNTIRNSYNSFANGGPLDDDPSSNTSNNATHGDVKYPYGNDPITKYYEDFGAKYRQTRPTPLPGAQGIEKYKNSSGNYVFDVGANKGYSDIVQYIRDNNIRVNPEEKDERGWSMTTPDPNGVKHAVGPDLEKQIKVVHPDLVGIYNAYWPDKTPMTNWGFATKEEAEKYERRRRLNKYSDWEILNAATGYLTNLLSPSQQVGNVANAIKVLNGDITYQDFANGHAGNAGIGEIGNLKEDYPGLTTVLNIVGDIVIPWGGHKLLNTSANTWRGAAAAGRHHLRTINDIINRPLLTYKTIRAGEYPFTPSQWSKPNIQEALNNLAYKNNLYFNGLLNDAEYVFKNNWDTPDFGGWANFKTGKITVPLRRQGSNIHTGRLPYASPFTDFKKNVKDFFNNPVGNKYEGTKKNLINMEGVLAHEGDHVIEGKHLPSAPPSGTKEELKQQIFGNKYYSYPDGNYFSPTEVPETAPLYKFFKNNSEEWARSPSELSAELSRLKFNNGYKYTDKFDPAFLKSNNNVDELMKRMKVPEGKMEELRPAFKEVIENMWKIQSGEKLPGIFDNNIISGGKGLSDYIQIAKKPNVVIEK